LTGKGKGKDDRKKGRLDGFEWGLVVARKEAGLSKVDNKMEVSGGKS